MRSDWFFPVLRAYHFLTDNSLQSADKDQQESRAVTEKPHDAVVLFDTYRNIQRHRAVLPAITRLFFQMLKIIIYIKRMICIAPFTKAPRSSDKVSDNNNFLEKSSFETSFE